MISASLSGITGVTHRAWILLKLFLSFFFLIISILNDQVSDNKIHHGVILIKKAFLCIYLFLCQY
jgi:hypothetical protein